MSSNLAINPHSAIPLEVFEFLGIEELSVRLGIASRTLRKWIAAGDFPPPTYGGVKTKSTPRFWTLEFYAWLRANKAERASWEKNRVRLIDQAALATFGRKAS